MSTTARWLPPIIDNSEYADWDKFLEEVYRIFKRDFLEGDTLSYRSAPVIINSELERGKEKTFWHLTHRTEKGKRWGRRKIRDVRRAERLPWIRPIITNHADKDILDFDYFEGQGILRTYLWLRNWDFVVILESLNGCYLLITAYSVDYAGQKEGLEKKYDDRAI